MSVYRTHFARRGRQYSNKYASANSTPWPFPNLPCVSVAVMTWTECRSISSHSFGSFVIWFLGHQAPPWLSVRRLKQMRNTLENVFYFPMFSLQQGKGYFGVHIYRFLTTVVLIQIIQRHVFGWLMNNELVETWNEEVVANVKQYSDNYLEKLIKTTEDDSQRTNTSHWTVKFCQTV